MNHQETQLVHQAMKHLEELYKPGMSLLQERKLTNLNLEITVGRAQDCLKKLLAGKTRHGPKKQPPDIEDYVFETKQ